VKHCLRRKLMPKRDDNTSALGIAREMPSFTVIWLKNWHFCAPHVDAGHVLFKRAHEIEALLGGESFAKRQPIHHSTKKST